MNSNKYKLSFLISLFFIILAIFTLTSCQDDNNYILTYSQEGNGYIECSYYSNTEIKSGTKVNLKAVGIQNDSLVKWYVNDKEYSSKDNISIRITSDTNVKAEFSGSSYKNIIYDRYSSPAVDEKIYCIKVLAAYKNGYFTTDGTGFRTIETEESFKYSVGDVLVHMQTFANDMEFTIALYKVDKVKISSNLIKLTDIYIQTGNLSGAFISATGKILNDQGVYKIQLLDSQYSLFLHEPSDAMGIEDLVNKYVDVKGYINQWYDESTLQFYITECQENFDVEDNNQGGNETPVNTSSIETEDLNKICAFFEENWEDVKIVVNGSQSYNMTKKDGYYTYNYSSSINKVQFKSGVKSTETFTIDSDRLVFICQDRRFNNLYSGYFTTVKDLNNSVVKLTTLSLNDLHGYITQTGINTGGISNTASLIDQIRNENDIDDVILAANGDMFQGTAVSNLTYGRSVVEAMNKMNFDFMGIGNHEFDWGIEKIFAYFDNDSSNGEANFPLLNSNIVYSSNNELVLFDGYNMFDTLTIEKNGLKIGVISCIGQLKSSILYTRVCNYEFKQVSDVAIPLAKSLKQSGVDVVIVNIHGGASSGVSDYQENQSLVSATYNNKPLIDLIINGHTHTNQIGYIARSGADMAILQASSYNYYLGEYEIYYDTVEEKVNSIVVNTYNINSTAGTNYDAEVQKVVDDNYNLVKSQIDEVYTVSGETISSKSTLYNWCGNVLKASVGAQVGISNTGGIRSTGNISRGTNICLENMYLINPFDNEIVLCQLSGKRLYSYLRNNSSVYYTMDSGLDLNAMSNSNEMYTVAVIDYVFYGGYFPNDCEYINTKVVFRDAMIEDLRLRSTFNPSSDSEAKIGNLYNK